MHLVRRVREGMPHGAIFEVMPRKRFGADVATPDKVVRSVCPYCGVGCQIDLQVRENSIIRVTSPSFDEVTPNDGSTCVKGRFGYDFVQHRDRLTTPLIRKGWTRKSGRWVWNGPAGGDRRSGPWHDMKTEGLSDKPLAPPRRKARSPRSLDAGARHPGHSRPGDDPGRLV